MFNLFNNDRRFSPEQEREIREKGFIPVYNKNTLHQIPSGIVQITYHLDLNYDFTYFYIKCGDKFYRPQGDRFFSINQIWKRGRVLGYLPKVNANGDRIRNKYWSGKETLEGIIENQQDLLRKLRPIITEKVDLAREEYKKDIDNVDKLNKMQNLSKLEEQVIENMDRFIF